VSEASPNRVVVLFEGEHDLHLLDHARDLGAVTVLGVGSELAHPALERALVHGAERAVRVWDSLLGSCDYLGVAHVLAVATRRVTADAPSHLVIAGDRGRNAVGPATAERLSIPHLGQITQISLRDGRAVVRRREGGLTRLFAAALPALLCLPPPRRPERAAPPAPKTPPRSVEVWTLPDLQLSAHELQYRRRFFTQAPVSAAVEETPQVLDAVALVDRLTKEGLLPEPGSAVMRGPRASQR
jgi:electron transfer flavoprotein alpha/beta subunit